jgi:hypothetical protein
MTSDDKKKTAVLAAAIVIVLLAVFVVNPASREAMNPRKVPGARDTTAPELPLAWLAKVRACTGGTFPYDSIHWIASDSVPSRFDGWGDRNVVDVEAVLIETKTVLIRRDFLKIPITSPVRSTAIGHAVAHIDVGRGRGESHPVRYFSEACGTMGYGFVER